MHNRKDIIWAIVVFLVLFVMAIAIAWFWTLSLSFYWKVVLTVSLLLAISGAFWFLRRQTWFRRQLIRMAFVLIFAGLAAVGSPVVGFVFHGRLSTTIENAEGPTSQRTEGESQVPTSQRTEGESQVSVNQPDAVQTICSAVVGLGAWLFAFLLVRTARSEEPSTEAPPGKGEPERDEGTVAKCEPVALVDADEVRKVLGTPPVVGISSVGFFPIARFQGDASFLDVQVSAWEGERRLQIRTLVLLLEDARGQKQQFVALKDQTQETAIARIDRPAAVALGVFAHVVGNVNRVNVVIAGSANTVQVEWSS